MGWARTSGAPTDKTLATVESCKDPDAYMMQSDADCDSDLALQSIVEVWPQLEDATKRRILELATGRWHNALE